MSGCLSFPADLSAAMYADSSWDAEKVSVHDAWHRVDEERFERLNQALRELLDLVRDRRT